VKSGRLWKVLRGCCVLLIEDIKQEVSEVAYVLVVLHKIDLYINQRTHKKLFEVYIPLSKLEYFFPNRIKDKIFFIENGFVQSYSYSFKVNKILFYLAWDRYYNQKIKPLAYREVDYDTLTN
jgi:hypothetical protein